MSSGLLVVTFLHFENRIEIEDFPIARVCQQKFLRELRGFIRVTGHQHPAIEKLSIQVAGVVLERKFKNRIRLVVSGEKFEDQRKLNSEWKRVGGSV